MKPLRILPWGLFLSSALVFPVKAQISPDGTTDTTVTPIDNGLRIDNGDRAGDNLFHSFEQFSIPTDSEAFFNNASDIVNIFSRVTGGDISNIDGLLGANGGANLFLINPAGIVFGEGARLDLGGSFFASTADSIIFPDEIEFSASDRDNAPLLTVNMPIGLNFGNNPGNVAVNGSNLQVDSGKTLAFLGGNVTITGGQIVAPGANIELGGLTEAGQINFSQSEDTFNSFSFPETIARGDVTLTNGTEVNVQSSGGGSIDVNARSLKLSGGESGTSFLRTGIAPESDSTEAQAGDITLNATDDITLNQASRIDNRVEESGVGNAGEIEIDTGSLEVTDGAEIDASTFGRGDAGAVNIIANNTISLHNDSYVFSRVHHDAEGNSGGVTVTTGTLSLTDGGQINADTFGRGNGADIIVNAQDSVQISGERRYASGLYSNSNNDSENTEGNAGNINIETGSLEVSDGAIIDASTESLGNAGVVNITATDKVSLHDDSYVFSRVNGGAEGNSGGVTVTTGTLSLTDGGQINADTFGRGNGADIIVNAQDLVQISGERRYASGLYSNSNNDSENTEGNAGNINIETGSLEVSDGARIDASAESLGDAAAVNITAKDTISIDNDSYLFSRVYHDAEGNSGGVTVTTGTLNVTDGGQINADTFGRGNGADIIVNAQDAVNISGVGRYASGLYANALDGSGNGGNIIIATDKLIVRDWAVVTVGNFFDQGVEGSFFPHPPSAPGKGAAGNLEIQARSVEVNERGKITADNANGIGGDLILNADSLTLKNGASVSASTTAEEGEGGILTLDIDGSLIMSDRSLISAKADSGSDGGNLTINAESIVAFPNQNNDIIANAARGDGGNINITTNALFGIAERSSLPANNTNDIDASSEFGLDGTVAINELDVNPAEELEELPAEVIDATRLVDQNLCQQGDRSEFIVTGKGGIAPNPSQVREGEVSEVDLVEPANSEAELAKGRGERSFPPMVPENLRQAEEKEIVEAQGWKINDRGIVELVAHSTDVNASPPQPNNSRVCNTALSNNL